MHRHGFTCTPLILDDLWVDIFAYQVHAPFEWMFLFQIRLL